MSEGEINNGRETGSNPFSRLEIGLALLAELEQRVGDDDAQPQLEAARSEIASASRHIESGARFERDFSKAMGMVASVAVSHGYDDLAEDALEIGGDNYGE